MLAGIEWENVSLAGAFLLGVVFATFATLRVVRAVASIFEDGPRRRRERRMRDEVEEQAKEKDQ